MVRLIPFFGRMVKRGKLGISLLQETWLQSENTDTLTFLDDQDQSLSDRGQHQCWCTGDFPTRVKQSRFQSAKSIFAYHKNPILGLSCFPEGIYQQFSSTMTLHPLILQMMILPIRWFVHTENVWKYGFVTLHGFRKLQSCRYQFLRFMCSEKHDNEENAQYDS